MSDTTGALRHVLEDPENRAKLLEILAIRSLLEYCIIGQTFRLSDDWTKPIRLTSLGSRIVNEALNERRRIKPNDAKMSAFLEFGCAAGLLVDLATDVSQLRSVISDALRHNRIWFPYIFGRELHDRAVEMFPEKTHLTNEQTIRLLKELPAGVFQVGHTVVGPFGCTYSDVSRSASSSFSVPGYLCSDETCQSVHSIRLSTADTTITKARTFISDYIDEHYSDTADENIDTIYDAAIIEELKEKEFSSENLIDVLSDGLSEEELRAVIDRLLRAAFKTEGARRDVAKRLGAAITNPSEFVAGIERPELMQIALLYSDRAITRAIEEALNDKALKIQDFELRVSRVRRWDPEADLPTAEIGRLGVRFRSFAGSRFVPRRMLSLLQRIYLQSELWDAADLAYALEAPNNLSEGELLDQAIRQYSPRQLFTNLILSNRRAVIMAAEELDIWNHEQLSRDELLDRFIWKIGEPARGTFTELSRVREFLDKLENTNAAGSSADMLRSHSSPLFAAIEDTLGRALIFSVWSVTNDHYLASEGFEYDPLTEPSVVKFIEDHAPTEEQELLLQLDGKSTLVALSAGFARLAKALRKLDPKEYRRPSHQLPPESSALSRPFAFPHEIPFLDLANASQSDFLTALQKTTRLMQSEDVVELRNATSHGNRPFPHADSVSKALGNIRELLSHLKETGLYPRMFELESLSRDGLGREEFTYREAGSSVNLFRPTWAFAPRFPIGQLQLIIMPVAKTVSAGPMRFRLRPRPGKDPYWDGWPKRWHVRTDYGDVERSVSRDGLAESA